MFELVNESSGADNVISRHRSYIAAVRADRKLQDRTRKANGQNSFLQTRIDRNGTTYIPSRWEFEQGLEDESN